MSRRTSPDIVPNPQLCPAVAKDAQPRPEYGRGLPSPMAGRPHVSDAASAPLAGPAHGESVRGRPPWAVVACRGRRAGFSVSVGSSRRSVGVAGCPALPAGVRLSVLG